MSKENKIVADLLSLQTGACSEKLETELDLLQLQGYKLYDVLKELAKKNRRDSK